MDKLFFVIYKKDSKEFYHMIGERKSKKAFRDELRDEGFTPKAIFSEKDIAKVLDKTFLDTNVSDKELDYLVSHLDDWNKAKGE